MLEEQHQSFGRIKILWVAPSVSEAQDPMGVSSPLPSVRLRCLEIMRFFNSCKSATAKVSPPTVPAPDTPIAPRIDIELICGQTTIALLNAAHLHAPDLIIFGTLFAPLAPAIVQLHKQGIPIAMDLFEDIFNLNDLLCRYSPLFSLGLHWIAASDFLYEMLQKKSASDEIKGSFYVIKEPPEGLPSRTTRIIHAELGRCESQPLELVWIGGRRHMPALCDFLDSEKSLYSTIIVVSYHDETLKQLAPYLKAPNPRHRLHLVRWSLENQRNAIMKAHGTLIPCSGDGALAESANRLITSLWFGTPVVAHPIPSFKPFTPFSHQHKDLTQAIEGLLSSHWDKTEEEVREGQRFIQTHFNIDIICEQWRTTILQIALPQS